MDIKITIGRSPFLLSIEDKAVIMDGQTEFVSLHNSPLVTAYNIVCTQQVYNAIKDSVGTINAPALIANSAATPYAGRVNCYIENGSLKVLA